MSNKQIILSVGPILTLEDFSSIAKQRLEVAQMKFFETLTGNYEIR